MKLNLKNGMQIWNEQESEVYIMNYQFSPSLMCMDLTQFREQIEILNKRADRYHVDIMDGHYVKNMTLSPFFIEQLKKVAKLPIDAHLMVEDPVEFIDMTIEAGADCISIHAEMINHNAFRLIRKIKDADCQVGIVLNPAIPLDIIQHYAHLIDRLTFMTVDPGFAGQKFITEVLGKIHLASAWKKKKGYYFEIEVDGSCNQATYQVLRDAGTETFIVGTSGLFGLDDDLNLAWDKMLAEFS